MLIPVRCFTCNSVIGDKWKPYQEKVKEYLYSCGTEMEARDRALNEIGLPAYKYCCRRMLLSHVNVIDNLLLYSNNPGEKRPSRNVNLLPDDYKEILVIEKEVDDVEDDPEYTYIGDDNDYTYIGDNDYTYIGDDE